jgi:hypothetical protein
MLSFLLFFSGNNNGGYNNGGMDIQGHPQLQQGENMQFMGGQQMQGQGQPPQQQQPGRQLQNMPNQFPGGQGHGLQGK